MRVLPGGSGCGGAVSSPHHLTYIDRREGRHAPSTALPVQAKTLNQVMSWGKEEDTREAM